MTGVNPEATYLKETETKLLFEQTFTEKIYKNKWNHNANRDYMIKHTKNIRTYFKMAYKIIYDTISTF